MGRARRDRDGLGEAAAGRPGGLVGVACVVAGRGDICHALSFNGLNGLCDDAVLEKWLIEIANIIADDLAAGGGERKNAIGEILLALVGGIESHTGARSD